MKNLLLIFIAACMALLSCNTSNTTENNEITDVMTAEEIYLQGKFTHKTTS